jgi:hypothetical protein
MPLSTMFQTPAIPEILLKVALNTITPAITETLLKVALNTITPAITV